MDADEADAIKEERYAVSVASFNELAELYAEHFRDFAFYQPTYDRFLELLTPRAKLLEVACGPGNVTSYLLKQKASLSVLGVDLAPQMIALATAENPEVDYRVLDARQIGTLGQQFDAVMSAFYLPYVAREDAVQHLHDIASLLRAGGHLYLSTIEGDYAKSTYRTRSTGRRVFTYFYDYEFLQRTLGNFGFEIIDSDKKRFPRPDDSGDLELFYYCCLSK